MPRKKNDGELSVPAPLAADTYWKMKAICLKYRSNVRDTLEKIILDHYENLGGTKHA